MRVWTKLLGALLIVLLGLAGLVWFFPARWAVPQLERRLPGATLRDVHGTVWNGRAGEVSGRDGTALGALTWQLSRRALLGDTQLHFELLGPVVNASGAFAQREKQATYRDVHLQADLAQLPPPPALQRWGTPLGQLDAQIADATIENSWPMELAAQAQWHAAAVHVSGRTVALGDLNLQITGSSGVISGTLADSGQGPLSVRGSLQASPLGGRYALDLTPRRVDPALNYWLAQLRTPDASGRVHLEGQFGLAALAQPPSAQPSEPKP